MLTANNWLMIINKYTIKYQTEWSGPTFTTPEPGMFVNFKQMIAKGASIM